MNKLEMRTITLECVTRKDQWKNDRMGMIVEVSETPHSPVGLFHTQVRWLPVGGVDLGSQNAQAIQGKYHPDLASAVADAQAFIDRLANSSMSFTISERV